jgi:hypothetical protein
VSERDIPPIVPHRRRRQVTLWSEDPRRNGRGRVTVDARSSPSGLHALCDDCGWEDPHGSPTDDEAMRVYQLHRLVAHGELPADAPGSYGAGPGRAARRPLTPARRTPGEGDGRGLPPPR